MNDELREEVALTLKRRPWMNAEDWSIWRVTDHYDADSGTFRDCLCMRMPDFMTGGAVVFEMLPPLHDILTPENIERGIELVLVERGDGDLA